MNFTDRTMGEFFRDDVGIDIYSRKYAYASGSKANRLRGFWLNTDDSTVGAALIKLVDYIESQIVIGNLTRENFPNEQIQAARAIAEKLWVKTNR